MYLQSHMWLVAIALDSTALEQRACFMQRTCAEKVLVDFGEPKVLGCMGGVTWDRTRLEGTGSSMCRNMQAS